MGPLTSHTHKPPRNHQQTTNKPTTKKTGRGLFVRAVMKAQLASPGFTHIYAALVAVVNTKLPEVGELLLKRVSLVSCVYIYVNKPIKQSINK
jgi:hypothetical protein